MQLFPPKNVNALFIIELTASINIGDNTRNAGLYKCSGCQEEINHSSQNKQSWNHKYADTLLAEDWQRSQFFTVFHICEIMKNVKSQGVTSQALFLYSFFPFYSLSIS